MGCLFEILFEVFLEAVFEGLMWCYIKLMQLIVPEKNISNKTKNTIKKIITATSAILFIFLIIGAILWVQNDIIIKNIGKYMTLIPLTLIVLEILLGIILKIASFLRK